MAGPKASYWMQGFMHINPRVETCSASDSRSERRRTKAKGRVKDAALKKELLLLASEAINHARVEAEIMLQLAAVIGHEVVRRKPDRQPRSQVVVHARAYAH